jgi:hypothetical protein
MTPQQIKAMKQALEALEQTLQTLDDENAKPGGAIADTIWHSEHETLFDYLGSEITAIKKVVAEHAMQEVQRLGQEIEQEPVAHLWECLGRWSAYLVNNGTQAKCAPPSWLVEAVKNATTPPQRTWVGLTVEEIADCCRESTTTQLSFYNAIEAKLKEKNA